VSLVDVRPFSAETNETTEKAGRRNAPSTPMSVIKNAVSLFETHRRMNPERIDPTEPLDEVVGE